MVFLIVSQTLGTFYLELDLWTVPNLHATTNLSSKMNFWNPKIFFGQSDDHESRLTCLHGFTRPKTVDPSVLAAKILSRQLRIMKILKFVKHVGRR